MRIYNGVGEEGRSHIFGRDVGASNVGREGRVIITRKISWVHKASWRQTRGILLFEISWETTGILLKLEAR